MWLGQSKPKRKNIKKNVKGNNSNNSSCEINENTNNNSSIEISENSAYKIRRECTLCKFNDKMELNSWL